MAGAKDLSGLRVLLTGAANGIGRRLAVDLHAQGCRLILLDKDANGLQSLAKELSQTVTPAKAGVQDPGDALDSGFRWNDGSNILSIRCDLASREDLDRVLAKIAGEPIDVLINNAGIAHVGTFEMMPAEDFEAIIAVNLLAAVRLTRGVLPKLLNSRRGAIVNIGSLAGLIGAPGMAAYSASKFGLMGFSEALRLELKGRVRVCAVCPAFIKTGIAESALLNGPDREARIGKMNGVLARFGGGVESVSRVVLGSLRGGPELVLVGADAKLLYHLNRLAPPLARAVIAWGYSRLRRDGVIE